MENSRLPDPKGSEEKVENLSAFVLIILLAAGLYLEQSGLDPWIKVVGALLDATIAVLGVRRLRRHLERFLGAAAKRIKPWLRRRRERWRDFRDRVGSTRLRNILAGLATVAMVATVLAIQSDRSGVAVAAGCPVPHELRVLTSTDSADWARQVFDAYARSTAVNPAPKTGPADDRCPTVHVLVYTAPAQAAMSALANGWTANDVQNPLRDIGPRPDLWLPDSTLDVAAVLALAQKSGLSPPVALLRAAADGHRPATPDSVVSLGTSRIVVAARTPPFARSTGAPSWPQALTAVFGAGAGLVAPDPGGSTTGLYAMISYLLDGSEFAGPAVARQRVQAVTGAKAVPGEDSVTALCRAGHDSSARAVVTSDQLWRLYSADGRPGDFCPGGHPDFTGWSASQPGDGPVLDHPLVQPTWTWSNQEQQTATQGLRAWLRAGTGRDVLKNVVHLGDPLDCLAFAPTFVPTPCVKTDPEQARQRFDAAKSPGRVLMAMDSSGSMSDPAGPGGSRFAVASAAFAEALGQIGAQDEVGLWTFPDRPGPYRKLLDLGVGTAARRTAAINALAGVKPTGNTPLYRTIVDGLGAVSRSGTAGQTRALVVLTDGQDTSSNMTLRQAQDSIESISAATGARLFIVAIGEAACGGAHGLSVLTDGHGRCLDADLDEVAATMAQLFESLWKGQ